jgi:hypothetical protein
LSDIMASFITFPSIELIRRTTIFLLYNSEFILCSSKVDNCVILFPLLLLMIEWRDFSWVLMACHNTILSRRILLHSYFLRSSNSRINHSVDLIGRRIDWNVIMLFAFWGLTRTFLMCARSLLIEVLWILSTTIIWSSSSILWWQDW